jgi:hypothetical protein
MSKNIRMQKPGRDASLFIFSLTPLPWMIRWARLACQFRNLGACPAAVRLIGRLSKTVVDSS